MAIKRRKSGQFRKGSHWRESQLFRNKRWLCTQYIRLGRSSADIAKDFGVTDTAILFWLRKHKLKRRSISEARKFKRWGSVGSDNPMWNKKGELNPNWRGGITPERQLFYQSQEWKTACSTVWKRDNATCQRCGLHRDEQGDMPFDIHHIESFAVKELRAVLSNLVLLCQVCHDFVHSRRNVKREFLSQK